MIGNKQKKVNILAERQVEDLRVGLEKERSALAEKQAVLEQKAADADKRLEEISREKAAWQTEKKQQMSELVRYKAEQTKLVNDETVSARQSLTEEIARKKREMTENLEQSIRSIAGSYNTYLMQLKMQMDILTEAACNTTIGVLGETESDGADGAERFQKELADVLFKNALEGKNHWEADGDYLLNRALITVNSVEELKRLGSYGFRNNLCLKRIELPEGMTVIPPSYFFGCTNLREVVLPLSLRKISEYAFYGCSSLGKINLSAVTVLEEIGDYAFSLCEGMDKVVLPEGLKRIGTGAFRCCGNLEEFGFPSGNSPLETGSHLLQYCKKLTEVILPEGDAEIQTSMFYGCEALKIVNGPGVKKVGPHAFSYCAALEKVSLGVDAEIDENAFEGAREGAEILVSRTPYIPISKKILADEPARADEAASKSAVAEEDSLKIQNEELPSRCEHMRNLKKQRKEKQ